MRTPKFAAGAVRAIRAAVGETPLGYFATRPEV